MRFGTVVGIGVLLGGLLNVSPQAALAETRRQEETWKPRVEARLVDGDGELLVNERLVVRFRERRSGLSPYQRAVLTADRLRAAINLGLSASDVRISDSDPDNVVVKARGWVVATATAEPDFTGVRRAKTRRARIRTARAQAEEQARRWASNLRNALSVPGLTVEDSGEVIPLGEARRVRLTGAARGPITVTVAPEGDKTIGVVANSETGVVTLTGLEPGRRVLTFWREGAKAAVYVAVRPYAAQFSTAMPITVTGSTVPASMVQKHALARAWRAIDALPGAKIQLLDDTPTAHSLTRGGATTVSVPFRVTGPEMLTVTRRVQVPVVNRELPAAKTSTLFYSNNPERIVKPGALFAGRLTAGANIATRLLYHHQSAMATPFRFTAELVNDGDTPAKVHLSGNDAGPVRDTVWVGFRAAADFVKAYQTGVGAVVEVPPHSRMALSTARIPAGLTISGLWELRLLSGPAPLVRVTAEAVDAPGLLKDTFTPVALATPEPVQTAPNLSDHVYPDPEKQVAAKYEVGGRWQFLALGKTPLTAVQSPDRQLYGNYGVFYDFDVTLENPTDRESKARVVFEPSAGMAGGIFLIGDRKVEIPQTNLPQETTLASYMLAPGEKRQVRIRTLPLSGSNYPATIILCP